MDHRGARHGGSTPNQRTISVCGCSSKQCAALLLGVNLQFLIAGAFLSYLGFNSDSVLFISLGLLFLCTGVALLGIGLRCLCLCQREKNAATERRQLSSQNNANEIRDVSLRGQVFAQSLTTANYNREPTVTSAASSYPSSLPPEYSSLELGLHRPTPGALVQPTAPPAQVPRGAVRSDPALLPPPSYDEVMNAERNKNLSVEIDLERPC